MMSSSPPSASAIRVRYTALFATQVLWNSSPCITHDDFLHRLIDDGNVFLCAGFRGHQIRFQIVSGVNAAGHQPILGVALHHHLKINIRQMAAEIVLSPVEAAAQQA